LGRRATNSVLSGLGELAGVEELVRCRVTWSREHALKFNFATSELSSADTHSFRRRSFLVPQDPSFNLS
jgi:hypothetical protein